MLATITKAEESAALKVMCDAYLARGGKITTFANMPVAMKRARRAEGLVTGKTWDMGARAEFAQDDANYYIAGEYTEAGYNETGIQIRARRIAD